MPADRVIPSRSPRAESEVRLDGLAPRTRAAVRRDAARQTASAVVLFLVAFLAIRAWLVEGLFPPLSVCSGSMAPHILGPHCRFECDACGRPFVCGADVPEIGQWRVCPHCGKVAAITEPPEVREGDRVILIRTVFGRTWPRRWEIVAFRDPQRSSRVTIKRVVGLPGETVWLQGGDVYVNGQIAAKDSAAQTEMAVLVHDAAIDHANSLIEMPRWKPAGAGSFWKRHDAKFAHQGKSAEPSSIDWLVYTHQQRRGNRRVARSVTDELSYNQWLTLRTDEVEAVRDLTLCFRATDMSGEGWLVIQAADGLARLETWIRPKTGMCEFRFLGRVVESTELPFSTPVTEGDVAVSLIDGQWLLAWNGRVVLRHERPESDADWRPSHRPFAVGSADLALTIEPPRIYRDAHYCRPPGVLARWGFDQPVILGPDEFFVLGDNSRVSDDSRTWPERPGLPASLLIGKPVTAIPHPCGAQ